MGENLKVMSIGFLLGEEDGAVVWRGPMKAVAIQQFLGEVQWGELDYLIVDSPPGTGDEPLAVCQAIGQMDGAIIVTTPQETAFGQRPSVGQVLQLLDLQVLGVIENMAGFVCPDCERSPTSSARVAARPWLPKQASPSWPAFRSIP